MGVQVLQEHIESMMKTIAGLEERLARAEGERDALRVASMPDLAGLEAERDSLTTRLSRARGLIQRNLDMHANSRLHSEDSELDAGTGGVVLDSRIGDPLLADMQAYLAEGEGEGNKSPKKPLDSPPAVG